MIKYREFGFGVPTGIGINDEKSGIVPTREWKRMRFRKEWVDGETLSVAIGQSFNLVTPLQLAMAYATMANGGVRYKAQILDRIVDAAGGVVEKTRPEELGRLSFSSEHLGAVRKGLWAVVNSPGGTAYWAVRIPELEISGKTGTAQVIRQDENTSKRALEMYKDHALFAAYAPTGDPQLAIAVIVEHGEHGSTGAGPVAKAAFQYWFIDRLSHQEAMQEPEEDQPHARVEGE